MRIIISDRGRNVEHVHGCMNCAVITILANIQYNITVNESRDLCECVGGAQPGCLQCGMYVCMYCLAIVILPYFLHTSLSVQ